MSKHKCCIQHRTKATNEPSQGMEIWKSHVTKQFWHKPQKQSEKLLLLVSESSGYMCTWQKTCWTMLCAFLISPAFFQHQPGRDMRHAFLPNWIPTQTEPPSLRDQEKCGSWQKSSDEVSDFSFGHTRKEPQKQYWEESMPSPKELPWAIAEKESNISLLLI